MTRFDAAGLEEAFRIVADGIGRGAYPGAVAAVGCGTGPAVMRAFGHASLEPEQADMQVETVFDLASLTKVVATTPAVLKLAEEGRIGLDQPLRSILPDFADGRVTVRHLLTHTSGLPPWQGLYLDHLGWAEYTRAICSTPLVRAPGEAVAYSDLGFILLGALVMAVTGLSLPEYCRQAVFAPLGMEDTGWLPALPQSHYAATERGNRVEFSMCGERASSFTRWRSYVLRGEVNDGNAWYGLGGVSSHAGLFGTAADLARYAAAWLRGGGPILQPATVAEAMALQTAGLAESRGLGWAKAPAPSAGGRLSPGAIGHTGFTGTSLWIDPEMDIFAILLTNRLHPEAREGIMEVRRAFHDAVVASLAP